MTKDEVYRNVKEILMVIKKSGSHFSMFEETLFYLFVYSYMNNYMDYAERRLTADAIIDDLVVDKDFVPHLIVEGDDLLMEFSESWYTWTKAFHLGLSNSFIEFSDEAESRLAKRLEFLKKG
ncbi:MAG: hypothetical protein K2X50_00110 [Gammaproteobacteria bacterium]|nr:hypothetical protein [Gammaproteobacteria bacterium]